MSDLLKYYGTTPWWKPRSQKMRIEILEYGPTTLRFKVYGETHTLFNALRVELLSDDDVEFAAYKIEHPLFDRVEFVVRTRQGDPLEAIRRAVNRLRRKLINLKKKFQKAFEEGVTNPPFVNPKEWEEFIKKSF
ncbi:MAG: DNA-directed RNA polymerase subunit L [Candidatus Njordarchaeales archaeon]